MSKIPVIYDHSHKLHDPSYILGPFGSEKHPENPERAENIINEIINENIGEVIQPSELDEKLLLKIHQSDYLNYLRSLANSIEDDGYHYPYNFNSKGKKTYKNYLAQLGVYCSDASTPVNKNIYKQALLSCKIAYTAAKIANEKKVSYALCRPPGHHATKSSMGGFCYLSNGGVAAEYLSSFGKVAILDIDFHHGNGTQDIFYDREDVLTISIHADPTNHYPYYSGYIEERGVGKGEGYNLNIPLPSKTTNEIYETALEKALNQITQFKPQHLVILLGVDTYEKDNLGDFKLTTAYYKQMAISIKNLNLPIVIIQEGGYHKEIGKNIVSFLSGFL